MRRVSSAGVEIAWCEQGDPARPTVLLVHGYPDSHRVWDEVADLLAERFHVVRYDVRGAGSSGAPRDVASYTLDHLVADMGAVLDAIGKDRVHLAGHDWGAIQGWEAITRPEVRDRVASFTAFGGPSLDHAAWFMRHGPRGGALGQAVRSWYIGFFQFPVVPELAMSTFAPRLITEALRLGEGVRPREGHPAATYRRDALNGIKLYRANMPARLAEPREVPLPDTPVQVIEAVRDPFVSPALLATARDRVPRLWHRRLHAGHWAQRSHPGVVARWIREFAEHIEYGGPPSRSLSRAEVRPERRAYDDHLVVVTGAGSGIGRATARAFAAHGAEVVCADIDAEAAERTAKETGGHPYVVDVADTAAMERFAGEVEDAHGVPDIVVNNAGIAVAGPFLDHTAEDWSRVFDVNLGGVVNGCRVFGRRLVERGEGGHLVNVASLGAFAPSRALPAYSASKAAVKTLGDCLRAEFRRHGIGVSTICPGFTSTPLAEHVVYRGRRVERERRRAIRALRLRRFPPERIAAHILRAVHRDQAVVPVNTEARLGYLISRLVPAALRATARLVRLR
ncbi:SDR family oxidoreductase [Bailinhaonella thermotolerans]|uniref:SDR family oxidoreductase n=1 Tax=Bailinhaonella thermotolerans TaxID=1070861 RepID=A0A3A4AEN6_9ACTN|nr:SDR family oxidoreductase [Bailinhaonella thermotolerans]RJL24113.1 SDR family oxidoreductase [Bailinhaonella thermotolerans]